MKRLICVAAALLVAIGALFSGCAPKFDKSPDQFEGIRWVVPDYSFIFNPSDGCKGTFTCDDTKFNISVEFRGSTMTVNDTDKNNKLFEADWYYEDEDYLYVYNMTYNKEDYKLFEDTYKEFMRLNQEKL